MEIQKRKTIDKISYPEARKIVASTYRQPENSYANAVRSTSPIDINSLVSRLVPEIEKIVNEIVNNKNNQTKVFLAPTTTAPKRNTSQEPQKLTPPSLNHLSYQKRGKETLHLKSISKPQNQMIMNLNLKEEKQKENLDGKKAYHGKKTVINQPTCLKNGDIRKHNSMEL
ncbi:hypothetical protein JTB14_002124 [Gonioctena quinquepunctata]|nr:hypothetical protein JTB14_002124 [Gonioctena quinquepunctata]